MIIRRKETGTITAASKFAFNGEKAGGKLKESRNEMKHRNGKKEMKRDISLFYLL